MVSVYRTGLAFEMADLSGSVLPAVSAILQKPVRRMQNTGTSGCRFWQTRPFNATGRLMHLLFLMTFRIRSSIQRQISIFL